MKDARQNMIDADDRRMLASAKRRVSRARNFPKNTCPASRHLHIMADVLAFGGKYHMFEEEPAHCAETLYAVLESLWKLRRKHPDWGGSHDSLRS